jgi:hypothetical protein
MRRRAAMRAVSEEQRRYHANVYGLRAGDMTMRLKRCCLGIALMSLTIFGFVSSATASPLFRPGSSEVVGSVSISVSGGVADFEVQLALPGWRIFGFSFNVNNSIALGTLSVASPDGPVTSQIPGTDHYSITLRLDAGPSPIQAPMVLLLPTQTHFLIGNIPADFGVTDFSIPNPLISKAYQFAGEFEVIALMANEFGTASHDVFFTSDATPPPTPPIDVPEPSGIALIGMALLSLFGVGLMRHRQAH